MEFMANPTLLGGTTGVLMVAAWALGRWQASPALSSDGPVALPLQREPETPPMTPQARMPDPGLDQQHSRPEGAVASDIAISLCDLHAEISAFRRREQVLATLASDALMLDGLLRASMADAAAPMPNGLGYHRGRT